MTMRVPVGLTVGHGLVGMRERVAMYHGDARRRTVPDRRVPRRRPSAVRGAGMTVRVGVADDQPLIRAGLRTMIDHAADLELVGEAADGEQAVELARRHRPDVVLMDVRMPVLDGIEATRQITADPALAGVRVVVLTTFDVESLSSCLCKRAVHGGVRGGGDAVGVDEGELLEGLFPVRGDLSFDESAGCFALVGG